MINGGHFNGNNQLNWIGCSIVGEGNLLWDDNFVLFWCARWNQYWLNIHSMIHRNKPTNSSVNIRHNRHRMHHTNSDTTITPWSIGTSALMLITNSLVSLKKWTLDTNTEDSGLCLRMNKRTKLVSSMRGLNALCLWVCVLVTTLNPIHNQTTNRSVLFIAAIAIGFKLQIYKHSDASHITYIIIIINDISSWIN